MKRIAVECAVFAFLLFVIPLFAMFGTPAAAREEEPPASSPLDTQESEEDGFSILDTSTGWPVQNELAGITILASDAFDADALSTTVFAMGLEEGTAFVEGLDGVEAVFITRDEQVSWTSGLNDRLTLLNNG